MSDGDLEDNITVEADVSVRGAPVDIALALLATELGLSDRQANAVARFTKHYMYYVTFFVW